MNRKKHIAMYIGSLGIGGAERVMGNLAEYFYHEGYDVTIVTTYLEDKGYEIEDALWKKDISEKDVYDYISEEVMKPNDDLCKVYHVKDLSCAGIRRVFSGLLPSERRGRLYNLCSRIKKLERIWKDIKPDIILSFMGKNNIMAIKSAQKLGIPVVISIRANPPMEYYTKLLKFVANRFFSKAAGVVVQTSEAPKFFNEKVQEKCIVLPNPVSEEFISRNIIPWEERGRTIVSVGRIDENKNQIILIKAFSKLAERFSDYQLLIIGDGYLKKMLEEESHKHISNPSQILFTGNISNVAEIISHARIFVLTSREEGMPNALIEAMTMGLAVISTDCPCGGPADVISNNENGILVPMGTDDEMIESLAAALEKIMLNDTFAKKLSKNSALIRDKYSSTYTNPMWREYIDKIIINQHW